MTALPGSSIADRWSRRVFPGLGLRSHVLLRSVADTCGTLLKRRIEPYLLERYRRRRAVFDPTPASSMRYAVRDEPCMTRLTTMAAMPARTALAIGDDSMSVIGLDPDACS